MVKGDNSRIMKSEALVTALERAAENLAFAEAGYRLCYGMKGCDHAETIRAWDNMRRCGDKLREALAAWRETQERKSDD